MLEGLPPGRRLPPAAARGCRLLPQSAWTPEQGTACRGGGERRRRWWAAEAGIPVALPECYRAQLNARTTLHRTHTPLVELQVAQAACEHRVGQVGNADCCRRSIGRVCRAGVAAGSHGGRGESGAAPWSAARAAAGHLALPSVELQSMEQPFIQTVQAAQRSWHSSSALSGACGAGRQVLTCCTAADRTAAYHGEV